MNRNNRKKEITRRVFVYAVMSLSVVILLSVLMFLMLGYRYDLKNKTITQAGLVQFDSFPRNAMVSIDGRDLARTRTKSINFPGQHQFSMHIDGYETWQKTVEIKADTVTHLNYARLIPLDKKTNEIKNFPELISARFSPAGRLFIGVVRQNSSPSIVWGDVRDANNPKFTDHTLDTEIVNGYKEDNSSHSLTIKEWDLGGRFVILKHTYSVGNLSRTQWLRLDYNNPGKLVDISGLIGLDVKDLKFIGSSGNEFYALQSTGELRYIDLSANSISGPILTKLESFSLYGNDTISYVATNESGLKLSGVWKKGWQQPRIVKQLSKAQQGAKLNIAVSRYFHKDTVAISINKEIFIYRGTLPAPGEDYDKLLSSYKKLTMNRPIEQLEFNDDGRFVLARDVSSFVSYDLEHRNLSQPVYVPLTHKLAWLDKFHLWNIEKGKLLLQEFDGVNKHELVSATAGYDVALSQDEKYIYYFAGSGGQIRLHRLNMTIDQ